MHRSYGLQGSLKRRYKHPSPTSINGYHTAKKLLSQSPAKRPTFAFADESGYTLAFANRIAHSGSHAETGAVSDGGAITTLGAFRTFTNIPGPGVRTANFAAFGSWSGGALEERREPSGQRCAYACRCSEASRPCWAAQFCCRCSFSTIQWDIADWSRKCLKVPSALFCKKKCPWQVTHLSGADRHHAEQFHPYHRGRK